MSRDTGRRCCAAGSRRRNSPSRWCSDRAVGFGQPLLHHHQRLAFRLVLALVPWYGHDGSGGRESARQPLSSKVAAMFPAHTGFRRRAKEVQHLPFHAGCGAKASDAEPDRRHGDHVIVRLKSAGLLPHDVRNGSTLVRRGSCDLRRRRRMAGS